MYSFLENYVVIPRLNYKPYIFKSLRELKESLNNSGIINLSGYKLRDAEIETLALGLNYIPSKERLLQSKETLQQWIRSINLAIHFKKFPPTNKMGWISSLAISNWSPPDQTWHLDQKIRNKIEELFKFRNSNKGILTPKPILEAISTLKNQNEAHILKSDKGRNTVLWSCKDYDQEALRQLCNKDCYKELNKEEFQILTEATSNKCKFYADNLLALKLVTTREHQHLITVEPSGASIYFLPKIHQEILEETGTYKGRPIVASYTSPTHSIDKYLTNITSLLLPRIPGSLKDTNDLLKQLPKEPLSEKAEIITADVVGLYPSIPWKEGISAAIAFYVENLPYLKEQAAVLNKLQPPPTHVFSALLELVITTSTITFKNQRFFHQIKGTAMGCCISVYFANTYMYSLTKNLIEHPPSWFVVFLRFIDDIIIIAEPPTPTAITECFKNISNPFISYTISSKQENQPFLDVSLNINSRTRILNISPYWKPTASGGYLHPSSNHPQHTIDAIPYAQYLRLQRNSSSKKIFKKAARRLTRDFIIAGYPKKKLKKARQDLRIKALKNPARSETDFFYLKQKFCSHTDWTLKQKNLNEIHSLVIKHYEHDHKIQEIFLLKKNRIIFENQLSIGKNFSHHVKFGF